MWIFLFILIAIVLLITLSGVLLAAPRYKGPVTDHFDGKRFINPNGVPAKGVYEVLKWMMSRKRGPWTEITSSDHGKHPLDHFRDGIRITFINHSTFLIQVDGLNILTDPVWSKRTSPFTFAGPKRMRPPGIRFEDLPRIHAVLLSHNHYDHLDLATMRMIFGGHHPQIITPLGVKAFLDQQKIAGAADLDWWDERPLNQTVKVQSVPAQHFSGRGSTDRDATLWCGYMITTSRGKIYFAGDTGYNNKTFKEIGERCGDIEVSLIPIGAYKPAWFMSPIHVSPEEAVQIHLDVRSKVSIATHFGTFPLADDGYDEPVNDLKLALAKHNLTTDDFIAMKEGEARVFE
jgi:L-ascorbate metabolism protein UlaG (beta-lactamase superfamily)